MTLRPSSNRIAPECFRPNDVRGPASKLPDEGVYAFARAYGRRLTSAPEPRGPTRPLVVVGGDARLSTPRLRRQMERGLRDAGCDVVSLSPRTDGYSGPVVSTPLAFFASDRLGTAGMCMVTASHNPKDENGLKLGRGTDGLPGAEVRAIGLEARGELGPPATERGALLTYDPVPDYLDYAKRFLNFGSRRFPVVVDAGNGAGALPIVPALKSLGFPVVPVCTQPDGSFPSHHADPTDERNLEVGKQRMEETGARLGLFFDADGDRVVLVARTKEGTLRTLHPHEALIVFGRAIAHRAPGATVVADSPMSMNVPHHLTEAGLRVAMSADSVAAVKQAMRASDAVAGFQGTGHIVLHDRQAPNGERPLFLDDAAYVALRFVELLSHADAPTHLTEWLQGVKPLPSASENHACPDDVKERLVKRFVALYRDQRGGEAPPWPRYRLDTTDGARVTFQGEDGCDLGWALVRASNTSPTLRIKVEATTRPDCDRLLEAVKQQLRQLAGREGIPCNL